MYGRLTLRVGGWGWNLNGTDTAFDIPGMPCSPTLHSGQNRKRDVARALLQTSIAISSAVVAAPRHFAPRSGTEGSQDKLDDDTPAWEAQKDSPSAVT